MIANVGLGAALLNNGRLDEACAALEPLRTAKDLHATYWILLSRARLQRHRQWRHPLCSQPDTSAGNVMRRYREAVTQQAEAVWLRLRGTPQEAKPAEFLERLRSRKAAVGASLDKEKTARKFDAPEGAPATAPITGVPSATAPPAAPKPPPPLPKKEEEVLDFATRLKRAADKALKDREKKKPGE